MNVRFRGVTSREGILVRGEYGWGECAPFRDYGLEESSRWLESALNAATQPPPAPLRGDIPVNVTIPVTSPDDARERVVNAKCMTAKVKVADPGTLLSDDVDRVRAVSEALNESFGGGHVRVDANGAWKRDEACEAIGQLQEAASAVGGLEYVEQPCASVEDLAFVRARVDSPIAADESIRRSADPLRVVEAEAADLAVIKVAPLGGIEAALRLQTDLGLPVVVSSAIDTSIGIATGVRLAAALPDLPFACGLNTGRLLAQDVVTNPVTAVDGRIAVDDTFDLEIREDCAPVDEETLRYWQERLEGMVQCLRS